MSGAGKSCGCESDSWNTLLTAHGQDQLINKDVVLLLGRDNVSDMQELMTEIERDAIGKEALFENTPDNADVHDLEHVSYARGKRAVDSKRWQPELPSVTGLYHAMVRGYQKDCRQHKLFIGVSGGCPKCSDAFYNLMLDVGADWTAGEVADSEEVKLRLSSNKKTCAG